jgi:hypothetical protein
MCGRYEVHTPVEDIARRFDAALTEDASRAAARATTSPLR